MASSKKRPNIVLLMPDQHRADMIRALGHPTVLTPHLDRLCREGVSFESAFCNGPLCMPARASLLSERYVRDTGVFENASQLAAGTPTFVRSLAEAGYHTACIGKMHLWVHGGHRKGGRIKDTRDERALSILRDQGFKEMIETTGKLAAVNIKSEYTDYLDSKGLRNTYQQFVGERRYGGEKAVWSSDPISLAEEDYIDAWHGRRVERWIKEYKKDEPFFLWVGFPGPHDPWDSPKEARERYRGVDMDMPGSLERPEYGKGGRAMDTYLRMWHNHSQADGLTDEVIANVRRAYYGDISVIDDSVGRIMAALEATGQADNTYVIYTGDHGEMMGEHRLLMKMVFYDQAVKVPMIMRPPGGALPNVRGAVVRSLVEHLDVSRTITDLAGAAPVEGGEGTSLATVFERGDVVGRECAVSQNYGFAMFRTKTHKLVVEEDTLKPGQLFDLVADPHENRNIVAEPEAAEVLARLMERARAFLRGDKPIVRPHRPMYQLRMEAVAKAKAKAKL